MKKIILCILAVVMIATLAVSCTTESDNNGETSKAPSSSRDNSESNVQSPEQSETETQKIDIGLPDDLDYNDKEVYIFHWNEYYPEFEVDDSAMEGDPVYDAIYKKNLYTEEHIGVKLSFITHTGDGSNPQEFTGALQNMMGDPSTPIDIMAAYSRTGAHVALNGLVTDLNVYENLDFTKEWWPKDIQEEYNIAGKLYFVSGDISTNLLFMMYGTYYNNALVQSYGLDDPIDLVKKDEWTIDKFMEMSTGVYEDRDGIDGPSGDDFFGLACAYWDIDAMFHAAGFKLVVKDDSGENIVKYDDNLFTDVVGTYVDKLGEWVKNDDIATQVEIIHGNAFEDGRSIFKLDAAAVGFSLRETEVDYRTVPMAKLDPEVQDRYITCLANPFSLYGITTKSSDFEMAAATLQTLGYYAYENTTPAIFEVTLKGKFSKDDRMIEMWEIMREGISFDMGRIYHSNLGYICDFVSRAVADGSKWANLTTPLALQSKTRAMVGLNKLLKELAE